MEKTQQTRCWKPTSDSQHTHSLSTLCPCPRLLPGWRSRRAVASPGVRVRL